MKVGSVVRHRSRVEFARPVPWPFLILGLLVAGCSHVPKEAVQLSYQVGQDLPKLQESYDTLIHSTYDHLRARRNAYIDDVWVPQFLTGFMEKGRLVDTATGRVVWSFESASFVPPTAGKEKAQLLATVAEWARAALVKIERKRKSLIDPLDNDEKELRKQVSTAFSRLIQANAYITAHLASLQAVQDSQDEVLQELKLKDLRDSINSAIAKASDKAAEGLDAVRKVDGLVEKVPESMKNIP